MRTDRVEINALRSADQEAFGRQGYLLLPALLEPALADFLWSYVHTKFAADCCRSAVTTKCRIHCSPTAILRSTAFSNISVHASKKILGSAFRRPILISGCTSTAIC